MAETPQVKADTAERRGRDNVVNPPHLKGKKTRDIAAEKSGFSSEFTFRQAKAIVALDRLTAEIENAPSLEAVEAIANAAAGYQRMFKPVNDVSDRAGEVWVVAEAKIGSEIIKQGDAKGTRSQLGGKKSGTGKGQGKAKVVTGGDHMGLPVTAVAVAELGLSKKRATRAKKLASLPVAERNFLIQQLRAGEVWTAAEVKIGIELDKMPKATGTRRQKLTRITGGAIAEPPVTSGATLAELGVSKKRSTRAKKLAKLPVAERNAEIKLVRRHFIGDRPRSAQLR